MDRNGVSGGVEAHRLWENLPASLERTSLEGSEVGGPVHHRCALALGFDGALGFGEEIPSDVRLGSGEGLGSDEGLGFDGMLDYLHGFEPELALPAAGAAGQAQASPAGAAGPVRA
jgi:hypothetical protein